MAHMEDMPDLGFEEDDWMRVGAAARLAGVDARTIRRWADRGRIRARVTPGGTRQVSRASVRAAFEQETTARRQGLGGFSPTGERATPEVTVLYLAEAAKTWSGWTPRHLSEARCWALLDAVRSLLDALAEVRDQTEDDLRDRDRPDESA
jgi:excisionase family DNA binding protein